MRPDLIPEIDTLCKTLRECNTQASAVNWMAEAHKLLQEAAFALDDRPTKTPGTCTTKASDTCTTKPLVREIEQNLNRGEPFKLDYDSVNLNSKQRQTKKWKAARANLK